MPGSDASQQPEDVRIVPSAVFLFAICGVALASAVLLLRARLPGPPRIQLSAPTRQHSIFKATVTMRTPEKDWGELRATNLEDCIHLKSQIDEKAHVDSERRPRFIVYHVSGNPGVIEYYRDFLTLLYEKLAEKNEELGYDFEVYGRSMSGFEVSQLNPKRKRQGSTQRSRTKRRALGLQEQIEAVEQDLFGVVNRTRALPDPTRSSSSSTTSSGTRIEAQGADAEPQVILIGHSVGAYIAMELIQRHRRRLASQQPSRPGATTLGEPRIVAGICLFPTIVDIALSQRGRKLTPFTRLPYFPALISLLARSLTTFLPSPVLHAFLSHITGFEARNTLITTRFLSAPRAVSTAMCMARDEMTRITADAWDDEVWGAASPSPLAAPRPKLFFFFGKTDYWVREETREAIVSCRGGLEEWRPRIEIDEGDLPHGFSIRHSEPVAERCRVYIEEVVRLLSA